VVERNELHKESGFETNYFCVKLLIYKIVLIFDDMLITSALKVCTSRKVAHTYIYIYICVCVCVCVCVCMCVCVCVCTVVV
jgi:hypothetical protein